MSDRLPPSPPDPAEMSLLFRRSTDSPGVSPPQHQAHTQQVPSLGAADQSGVAGSVLQRLLSRLTYGGLDPSQRLQLSITTSQRDPGGGTQPREADIEQQTAATAAGAARETQHAGELAGEAGEGRAAEAAERHRLSTSVLDIRQLASSIEAGLPFAVLLALLFIYRHVVGLLSFAFLTYVLSRLNSVIRAQVALKAQLQRKPLLAAGSIALVQVPVVCLVTWQQNIYKHLVLIASEPPITEFWDVLFAVVVADACARFVAVLAKVGVLLASRIDTAQLFRRRGHVLTAIEYCSGLYRGLLPVPLWYGYFKALPHVPGFVSTACSGIYIMLKCTNIYERLAAAGVAVRQAWQQSAYGSAPSQEEIAEVGNTCPICQDNLRAPIKLGCSHVFCEDCVSEWFERERSCPMCRAAIRPSNLKSHGDGYTTLVPILM